MDSDPLMGIQRQRLQSHSPPTQQLSENTTPHFTLEQAKQKLEEHSFLFTCLQRYILSQDEDIKQLKDQLSLMKRQSDEDERRLKRLKGVLKRSVA